MDDGEMTDTGKEQDRLAPMVAMRDEKTRGERGFKRVLGVTPAAFAREQRRERFRSGVRRPRMTVTEAVYEAGFGSPSRLYEGVGASLGMSPSAMKAGGAGETIHYSTTESPLGRLLVAATARGLCAVLFAEGAEGGAGGMGSPDAELIFELRQRFPQAALRAATAGGEALPGEAVQWVLSHLSEHPSASALPFHIRATAFQQRVWQALMRIPRGETRTYVEIAATIGSPRSVRAVGAACGANPLAVVIPCHRVVGAKGRLTGYRWGVERKKRLLELEAEAGKLAVAVGAPVLPSR
jgi:AraC family transcriptional regulator of adaptative response/methylated-DNA-[protein]-cysteine methyltransferase